VPAVGGGPAHVVDRRGGRAACSPGVASTANASASRARIGVGPAEPMHVPTRPSDTSSANEHTAITIALRVPTFANCCAASARTGTHTPAISSSPASALRLGPSTKSSIGTRRSPRADASSTDAPAAYRGGSASPAGEEDPRFPPIVPRLRICGDPTVRAAIASPGSRSPSSRISRV
jgi:hypothetical protein